MNNKDYKLILKNIRHDLINPINAMIGYSELLLDMINNNISIKISSDIDNILISSKEILSIIKKIYENNNTSMENIKQLLSDSELHYSLRTHLASVIGISDFLIEDITNNSDYYSEDINSSLLKINKSGKKLMGLINNLKKYSAYTQSELIETYYSDQYLKESSIRNLNFKNTNFNIIKPGNILIVDDEEINLELIEKILNHAKHLTFKAINAKQALDILDKHFESIDLILLDLVMPGINGIQLLKKIKNNAKMNKIPIIMLSAMNDLETIAEAITYGAEDFLMKPINNILLHARINNALDKKYFHDKEIKYQNKIKLEQKKSNDLLLNILPNQIADRLKNGETLIADDIQSATVLFSDIKGFTDLASKISAKEILMLLNNIFTEFDKLAIKHSLEKIKTIGDNYMLAGGVPLEKKNHAFSVAEMAIDMLKVLPKLNKLSGYKLRLRIGISSGPVSAGVIGKNKFIYDLWGDTVNVASRMESYGRDGHIHTSKSTYELLKNKFSFEKCPLINIPGKGKMSTYYLNGYK